MDPWPFSDPKNVLVFTTVDIMRRAIPITEVFHDAEDGAWQFHNFTNNRRSTVKEAALISLMEMFRIDPTIAELADLPLGWTASRESPSHPWRRTAKPADEG